MTPQRSRRLALGVLLGLWLSLGLGRFTAAAPQKPDTTPTLHPTVRQNAGVLLPAADVLGTIFETVEERQSLSTGDHVLIDVGSDQQIQVGDRLTILRVSPRLSHPVTRQHLGVRLTTLGFATVEQVEPTTAVLLITKAFDAVELGDHVVRTEDIRPDVEPAAQSAVPRDVRGTVVATKDDKVSVGEGDIVYVDRGARHGVQVGDRFDVFKEGAEVRHPTSQRFVRLPRQTLGELTIVRVQAHSATALVTESRREFSAGSPVALRPVAPPLTTAATTPPTGPAAPATEAHPARLHPCLEAARQAIRAAFTTGATAGELATAEQALARAEHRLNQARSALNQGDVAQAQAHLQAAESDCLTAQRLGQQVATLAASRKPAAPDRYTVVPGDTLWGISARPVVYQNPYLWPLIYRANREQIRDPDVIFPSQRLAIPRDYSPEAASTAIQRARRRGPWRLGDGPDRYILEGVR